MIAGVNPDTCVLALLKLYIAASQLIVSPECTKKQWPRSPCEKCGRFFRATTNAGAKVRPTEAPNHGLSRSMIADAIKSLMAEIGADPGCTPVSMRRGGISAALAAGVDEELRKIQSGHVSSAWLLYVDITCHYQLYAFPCAFST